MKNIIIQSVLITSALVLSACGQKGPLVLEEIPANKTQTPLENTNDVIPVEEQKAEPK